MVSYAITKWKPPGCFAVEKVVQNIDFINSLCPSVMCHWRRNSMAVAQNISEVVIMEDCLLDPPIAAIDVLVEVNA